MAARMSIRMRSLSPISLKEPHAEVVDLGTTGTRQCDIDKLRRRLQSTSTYLVCVDEAGPGGFGLSRSLHTKEQGCWGGPLTDSPKAGD
jgi:hypothetical protein